ncbi:MAG TPA: DUF5103 domain-containing protein, partial [Flavobacteriaceae bacterium]|nr:DUF5103 domain-containing protein [Flavobacteriaceae bacterium]
LNGDERDYYYTIEHYSYDWTLSDLAKSEYLNGFDDVRIENYQNSFNTLQMYSHYYMQIPNRDVRGITKSGNYLLRVFDDNRNLVFSRKFIVYEEIVSVPTVVKRSRDVRFIRSKQVVNFSVNSKGINLTNPQQNVKVLVLQNDVLSTAITNIKPQFMLGGELVYKQDTELAFWAGNEFLNFDNSDVLGATAMIRRVDREDLHVNYLYTNPARYNRTYTYNPDINGRFVVRNLRSDKNAIDAEYVRVRFALQYLEDLKSGEEIHIYGNFNNYVLDETTRMDYDTGSGMFRKEILLKQGFYNYKYVLKRADGSVDTGAIDGNFEETENDYTVIVYYKELGGRYDRVIGIGRTNSEKMSH